MGASIGSRIPAATFNIMTKTGPAEITTEDVFRDRSVVLFAVPGAFTPPCHFLHIPGYLEEYETFRNAGVDTVACTAVNDAFVLDVWADATDAKGKLVFLADGNADFVTAMGMRLDARALGLGIRSRRYALWAQDGIIRALNVEEDPTVAEMSSAHMMLKLFSEWNASA
ncbi:MULTISPECIES: peroxiredoxin [Rhodomicrobium]|uniref:peroxiredoxin n=1 Tax=Rhodomicrobium TaxID=1068 RepID=UPI000B4BE1BB|nr:MULTISPECIES: peroxiredoxin [Rhodomicrobium]